MGAGFPIRAVASSVGRPAASSCALPPEAVVSMQTCRSRRTWPASGCADQRQDRAGAARPAPGHRARPASASPHQSAPEKPCKRGQRLGRQARRFDRVAAQLADRLRPAPAPRRAPGPRHRSGRAGRSGQAVRFAGRAGQVSGARRGRGGCGAASARRSASASVVVAVVGVGCRAPGRVVKRVR